MTRRLLAALCFWLSVVAAARSQSAQRVLIWRPPDAEPALLAAFAHLEGELRLHAFEPVVLRADPLVQPAELARLAEAEGAAAVVALDGASQHATAHVFVGARGSE